LLYQRRESLGLKEKAATSIESTVANGLASDLAQNYCGGEPRGISSIGDRTNSPPKTHDSAIRGISSINYLIPPVLGEAAYQGFCGEFIRAIPPTEATDAGILAHLLPAVATAIGSGPYVFAGSTQPARINTNLIGPTSEGRKGTAFRQIDGLMKEWDLAFWDEQCIDGLSSGEGLIQKVSDRRTRNEDGTWEVEEVEKRVYVVEEELSRVLAQLKRDQNILSQVVRGCFDSGKLNVVTRNPLAAKDAHICITGHITQEELDAKFTETDMANGFGNRFGWFYVFSTKELPDAKPIPPETLTKFATRLRRILKFAHNQKQIDWNEEARELWHSVYKTLRKSKPGLAGNMLARGSAIVPRVALIYALLDESNLIRPEHLEAALAVWQYNVESVQLLFGKKQETKKDVWEDTLPDKIYKLLADGPLTTKQFYSNISGLKAADLNSALSYLVSLKRIRKTTVKRKGGGRPAEMWERIPPETLKTN
jgi:hypothetical protein